MLLFGYLGELGVIDKYTATVSGFIGFAYAFNIIYTDYARKSKIGKKLFNFLVTVWGLYGVVYLLNDTLKNNAFNMLDIVAKNFFGLYLSFISLRVYKAVKTI